MSRDNWIMLGLALLVVYLLLKQGNVKNAESWEIQRGPDGKVNKIIVHKDVRGGGLW